MDNETVDITVPNQLRPTTADVEKDYKYTRGQLYSIIEKGQEAINGILESVSYTHLTLPTSDLV